MSNYRKFLTKRLFILYIFQIIFFLFQEIFYFKFEVLACSCSSNWFLLFINTIFFLGSGEGGVSVFFKYIKNIKAFFFKRFNSFKLFIIYQTETFYRPNKQTKNIWALGYIIYIGLAGLFASQFRFWIVVFSLYLIWLLTNLIVYKQILIICQALSDWLDLQMEAYWFHGKSKHLNPQTFYWSAMG